MSDDQVLLVGGDSLKKNRRLFILIWGCEVILEEQRQPFVRKSNLSPRLRSKAVIIENVALAASHLVQFERHSDSRHYNFPEQLHVCEDPLVSH